MGSQNYRFSPGLDLVLRRHPALSPEKNRELAVDFRAAQIKVAECLALLGYPLERYVMEIRAGSLRFFREGADTDRKKGGKGKVVKKSSYRFGGLTTGHVEEYEAKVAQQKSGAMTDAQFTAWQAEFLMLFTFTVIEEISTRSVPPPSDTIGSASMKQLRWRLADALAAARGFRDRIVEGNFLLVAKVVQRVSYPTLTKDDLFSPGVEGLLKATNRYDPDEGRFSTYAMPWIHQEVSRYAQENNLVCHVPLGRQAKIRAAIRNGKPLSGIDNQLPTAVSIDAPVGGEEDAGFTLKEVLPDTNSLGPSEEVYRNDLSKAIHEQLSRLDPLSRLILALRSDMGNSSEEAANIFKAEVQLSKERGRRTASDARKSGDDPARLRFFSAASGTPRSA